MSIYLIKQIPDDYAEDTGLAKYNRSRMPGCKDVFQAYYDESSGIYNTGLEEDFVEKFSKNGKDYSKTSDFWKDFKIEINSNKPKIFDTNNIIDRIALSILFANKYVAPDKESIKDPSYKDALYYAYTEESEREEEISSYKKRDAALAKLLDISDDKNKMLLYGQYLEGIKYSNKFKEDTLFKMLRTYITDKDLRNADNFLKVVKLPVEDIQQKIIIDKAIKQRLIQRVSIGNKKQAYQFGNVTLGTTLEDVYNNLSLADYAPELLSIKKELENK